MTKVHRHKRIFYLPGLISLLGLPLVLCHFYGIQHKKTNQRTMPINFWWTPTSKYNDLPTIDLPTIRTYQRIDITGNSVTDKIKLDYLQLRLREMVAANDSIYGVQIHLGKDARYDSFVQTLNLCKIEKINVYAPYQNDIWILYKPPDPAYIPEVFRCSTTQCVQTITIKEFNERNKWEELCDKVESIVIEFWHILTGFLILCILGFLYLRQTI